MRNNSFTLLLIFSSFTAFIYAQDFDFIYAKSGTNVTLSQSFVDSSGNNYILGGFEGTFSFGGLEISSTNTGKNSKGEPFILKTNMVGNPIYLKRIIGSGDVLSPTTSTEKMAVNQKGEVAYYCRVYNEDRIFVGDRPIPIDTLTKYLIVKLSKKGYLRFVKQLKTPHADAYVIPGDIALDEAGNVFVTGRYNTTATSFDDNLSPATGKDGNENMFLLKYSDNEENSWLRTSEYDLSDTLDGGINSNTLKLDNDGNIYLLGELYGNRKFIFGESTVQNAGISNGYLAKFNKAGSPEWALACETDGTSSPEDVSVNTRGDIALFAFYSGTMYSIADTTFNREAVNYDAVLTKLSTEGKHGWSLPLNSNLTTVSDYDQEAYVSILSDSKVLFTTNYLNAGMNNVAFIGLYSPTEITLNESTISTGNVFINNCVFDNEGRIFFQGYTNNSFTFSIGDITINPDLELPGTTAPFFGRISEDGAVDYIYNKPSISSSNFAFACLGANKYGGCTVIGNYTGDQCTLGKYNIGQDNASGFFVCNYNSMVSISGSVVDEEGNAIPEGFVKLIGFTYRQRSPLTDSVPLNPDGSYEFREIPLGKYIVRAETDYNNGVAYAPSYHMLADHWEEARQLEIIKPVDQNNVIIIMKPLEVLEGAATLSGLVTEVDEEDVFKSTLAKPKSKGRASLRGNRLKSDYEVLQVTDILEDGSFAFYEVEDGFYQVVIEEPGLPHETYHTIELNGGEFYSNINYLVGEETIVALGEPQTSGITINDGASDMLQLYPNPSSGIVTLKLSNNQNINQVSIISLNGQTIKHYGNVGKKLTITDLPKGFYIAIASWGNNTERIKFVIQ